ncbi:hypothetical protein IFR05_009160 [Cadophora sp. M221]|nr:hypothetical protein IFR05_009160 [Cadophora sp. M221]
MSRVRKEGLLFYTGRLNFEFYDYACEDLNIDINPKVDIVYFGPNPCPQSVSEFNRLGAYWGFQRTAVHIDVLENGLQCHECDRDGCKSSGFRTPKNVDILNLLHGTHAASWAAKFLGLREVFLVGRYKTRGSVGEVACLEGRMVNASLGFCRPSESDEMVPLDDELSEEVDALNRDIQKVRDGAWMPTEGENRWVGEGKPVFEWMKLCL